MTDTFYRNRSSSTTIGERFSNMINEKIEEEKGKKKKVKLNEENTILNQEQPNSPKLPRTTYENSDNPANVLPHLDDVNLDDLKSFLFEELIEHVTSPSAKSRTILEFLLTYRSFCTSEEVLSAIINRCRNYDEIVQLRSIVLLRNWVDKHGYDFNKDKEVLVAMLTKWFEETKSSNAKLSKMIEDLLVRIDKPKRQLNASTVFLENSPPVILPDKCLPINEITLMDIDSLEFARQLTLIEEILWRNIQPWECFGQAWTKQATKEVEAPNICKFISWFNEINCWVQTEILSEVELRKRIKITKKFIDICEHLVSLNNFNGALEIISGINSIAVHRLRKTLSNVPNRKVYEKISELVHPKDNYKTLRLSLRTLTPPCIPYLGMYLTDLTFIEDGNFDETPDGKINFNKRKMIAATILEIQRYQQPPYSLTPVTEIQQFLTNAKKITNTSLLYNFSQYVEPRENVPQPSVPPELVEIIQAKEILNAKRQAAKNKIKSSNKNTTTSKKPKKKKMIVQNIFNKEKDVKSEDFSQSKTSDEGSNIRESFETITSNSNFESSYGSEETSDEEDFHEKIFSRQIKRVNDIYDAHSMLMESALQKLTADITLLRNNSVKYIEKERDVITRDLEYLKKKLDEEASTKWMTKEENDRVLADIEKQNEKLRKELLQRGVSLELSESEGCVDVATVSDGEENAE